MQTGSEDLRAGGNPRQAAPLTGARDSEITQPVPREQHLSEQVAMSWSWILGSFLLILVCSGLSLLITLKRMKKP
jgi:hypothetical protein